MIGTAAVKLLPLCFSTMRRLASDGQPIKGFDPAALRASGDAFPRAGTDCAVAMVDCTASSIATQAQLSGMSMRWGKR